MYKCNTKIAKHNHDCDTPAIPIEKLDDLVLQALAEKVIQPDRLRAMLKAMKAKLKDAQSSQNSQLLGLQKELAELELATARLYEAVEKGLLPMDSTLQDRAQKFKARRESILIEMAGTRQKSVVPLDKINTGQIQAFSDAMRAKLLDRESGFSKQYLRLLVNEIRVSGNEVRMTGSRDALVHAVLQKKMGTAMVPTFIQPWLPTLDSNKRPRS